MTWNSKKFPVDLVTFTEENFNGMENLWRTSFLVQSNDNRRKFTLVLLSCMRSIENVISFRTSKPREEPF